MQLESETQMLKIHWNILDGTDIAHFSPLHTCRHVLKKMPTVYYCKSGYIYSSAKFIHIRFGQAPII